MIVSAFIAVPVTVSAETGSILAEHTTPTIAIECSARGDGDLENDQFRVDIVVYNNPGIYGYIFELLYDNTKVRVVDLIRDQNKSSVWSDNYAPVSAFPSEPNINIEDPDYNPTTANRIEANAAQRTLSTNNGVYLSVIFKIIEDFEETAFTLKNELFIGKDNNEVNFRVINDTFYKCYLVCYNANGGTNAPAVQTKARNEDLILSNTIPTKIGYNFKGWSTSADGCIEYTPGNTYTANADITLYAVWEVDPNILTGNCGTDGSNVYYALNTETGLLKIMGSGAMKDYDSYSEEVSAPWISKSEYIKTVQISNGITNIGNNAFCKCKNITNVSIPNSVTAIGDSAFRYCKNLANISIPDSVKFMGGSILYGTKFYETKENWDGDLLYAGKHLIGVDYDISGSIVIKPGALTIATATFMNRKNVSSITMPNSVHAIGDFAFDSCTGLTSINIPDNVTSIGTWILKRCDSLNEISIPYAGDNDGKFIGSLFGGYDYKDNNSSVPASLKKVTITNTNQIDKQAFYGCNNIESIVLSEKVTSIKEQAFYGCSSLKSITAPGVKTIEKQAFRNTGFYNDSSNWDNGKALYVNNWLVDAKTTISGSYSIKPGTELIAAYAFSDCKNLSYINIPDSVKHIGSLAFYNTAYYNNASNWDGGDVLYVGKHLVNAINTLPSTYTVRNGTLTIADTGFVLCTNLKTINIPDSVTHIGESAFGSCYGLSGINMSEGLIYIGETAFFDCTKLESITIPNSVYEIGRFAFYHCESLTNITIPSNTMKIGEFAFCLCTNLSTITFETRKAEIGPSIFSSCHPDTIYCYKFSTIDKYLNSDMYTKIYLPSDYIPGDPNGDGEVNAKDAVLLAQKLAGWTIELDENAADCNGDGAVNAKDAVLLAQYLAGWSVTLG